LLEKQEKTSQIILFDTTETNQSLKDL
jgi:hypothetical protein